MPPTTPVLLAAAVLLGALTPLCAGAQASPYLPLDDPRLPLLEHLIARGATWRAARGVSGWEGPLELRATAGLHHIVNAAHEEGRTVNRFEGRLQATLGLGRRGILP